MDVRIHEVTARLSVVDGESLLTPQLMARIVAAVTQALADAEDGARRRRADTRVAGGACCEHCDGDGGRR
jgi:hypothetical protein